VDGACWVGNDIISADVALKVREVVEDATVVLIHHMSYIDYQGFKHGVGQAAKNKYERQRRLFARADRTFGVGPLLHERLADLLPAGAPPPWLIVPGLPDVTPRAAPSVFTACSFGRLDPENDRIKQGRLAVAGFAALVARSDERGMPKSLQRRPQLRLIGIGEPGGGEERGLATFAEQRAGRMVNLLALPYDNDRQRVLADLAGSSAALMLSWHEGFGLTGWEAIGAEVPLILGTNSGLYELIDARLGGAGTACVRGIDIHGSSGDVTGEPESDADPVHFTDDDVVRVCDGLLDIARDPDRARADAKRLRLLLVNEGCTWEHAARAFAEDLALPPPEPPPIRGRNSDAPTRTASMWPSSSGSGLAASARRGCCRSCAIG
jgi:glycosyltransferase involved in cell wall biosynthesis